VPIQIGCRLASSPMAFHSPGLGPEETDLLARLDAFLRGQLPFPQIENEWMTAWFHTNEDGVRSELMEFFTEVQEKLDMTSEKDPEPDARQYGWVGSGEFREWLRTRRSALPY